MKLEIDIDEDYYKIICKRVEENKPYHSPHEYEAIADGKPLEQEPKTGHWIETHDDWGNGIITDRKYKCSVCHGKHIDPEMGEWHEVFDYKYPFCPNCGAKMAESEE